jgi:hypothetical protein
MYAVDIAKYGMIYLPSFMKIVKDIQAILRFCLRSLIGCDAGITNGRDLLYTPIRWLHAA